MNATQQLRRSIEHHQPATVLAVSNSAPLELSLDHELIQVSSLDSLRCSPRCKLAYVNDWLEHESLEKGQELLACLRDLQAEIVYVLATLDATRWTHQTFAALGYRQVGQYRSGDTITGLFYFDIYHYKLTPDWLNPRFWAHPQRWDLRDL